MLNKGDTMIGAKPSGGPVGGALMVVFKDGISEQDARDDIAKVSGVSLNAYMENIGMASLTCKAGHEFKCLVELRKLNTVLNAEQQTYKTMQKSDIAYKRPPKNIQDPSSNKKIYDHARPYKGESHET